ncbi:16157_t:CDS:1, partial [Entrophospora sp. SA101]
GEEGFMQTISVDADLAKLSTKCHSSINEVEVERNSLNFIAKL